jgi:pimeloyl-ACP methyl ester carboxylesterase
MDRKLYINGHTIAALNLNPVDTPGQPVILLHGIGSSIHFWGDDQTPTFLKQGPCCSVSLPGHYPASFPNGFRKEQITANMLAELITKSIHELVGDRPVTLVGMSTGGFLALAVAAFEPRIASRVVCISGFCRGKWTGALGLFQKLARGGWIGYALFKLLYRRPYLSIEQYSQQWSVYANDVKAMYAYPYFRANMNATYDFFMQLNLNSLIDYFSIMPEIDIREWLPKIKAPTLVVAGDHDPIVPPSQAILIKNSIPNADLKMILGGGHMLFAERTLEYQQTLKAWFDNQNLSNPAESKIV